MADPALLISDLDFDLNQMLNVLLEKLATDPSQGEQARIWFNSTVGRIKFDNGTSIEFVVTPASTDTLSNKTIDAGSNTISNLGVANFAAANISSDLSTGTSTQLATADVIWNAIEQAVTTADALTLEGNLDCSTNPNYPAADAGHSYVVTVAGKIGGASGVDVEAGDFVVCKVDSTATGDHATVGTNWFVIQRNLEAATETTSGFARFATDAEVIAASSSNLMISPTTLDNLLTTNGYRRAFVSVFAASTGATITAATHGLGVTNNLNADIFIGASEPKVRALFSPRINFTTGAVTWSSVRSLTGHLLITG